MSYDANAPNVHQIIDFVRAVTRLLKDDVQRQIEVGQALVGYRAFAWLLPQVGLRGWLRGELATGVPLIPPVWPALFLSAAVWLLIYTVALFMGSLMSAISTSLQWLDTLLVLAALPCGPAVGIVLGYATYRRNRRDGG